MIIQDIQIENLVLKIQELIAEYREEEIVQFRNAATQIQVTTLCPTMTLSIDWTIGKNIQFLGR